MFAELIAIITAQTKLLMERQAAFERAMIKRFDHLDASQAEQTKMLREILSAVTLPVAVSATISADFEGKHVEGENIKMKVPMNSTGTLTVAYKNATGGPGRTDGPPKWTAAPDGMVTLTPSADGLTCVVVTLPVPADVPVNSVIITADADGDLGDGVVDIVNTAALDIFDASGNAVIGEITVGEFTPIPSGRAKR